MLIVLVHIKVLPESLEAFMTATKANAAASRREPGIARFDAIQQSDDPTRFVLIDVCPRSEFALVRLFHLLPVNKNLPLQNQE